MSTLTLHLSGARAPTAADSHSLAAPVVLVIILAAIIGLIAVSAVFRSASAAISLITQPTMAVFRLLLAALIVIVLLVAVLVSRPAEANGPTPPPTPTSHPTSTPTHATR